MYIPTEIIYFRFDFKKSPIRVSNFNLYFVLVLFFFVNYSNNLFFVDFFLVLHCIVIVLSYTGLSCRTVCMY